MEGQGAALHVCLHEGSVSHAGVTLGSAALLWAAPHKAWLLCTLLWVRGLASWALAYRFPRDMHWLFLIWKGLQFWKNLRFCVFICFLESNPGFLPFLLRAVLVDVAIARCRILPLHAGPFRMDFPGEQIFSIFKQCYRQLSITNQCLFLSSSSSHPLKVLSHACSCSSFFLFL